MERKYQRALSARAIEEEEEAFAQEHNIELGQNGKHTPSSAFLAPILERPTVKRKFRKRSNPSPGSHRGFPEIGTNSRVASLARKRGPQPKTLPESGELSEADRRIAAMDETEIQSALDEIHQALPAELVSILKARGSKSAQTSSVKNQNETQADSDPNLDVKPLTEGVTASISKKKSVRFANQDDAGEKQGTSFLADSGVPVEKQKLEWINDVENEAQNQKLVDETLRDCSKELGEYGSFRFNFDGSKLSHEQMKELPSHLGLHHHGADPSKAGYTLIELILLTRSSVPSQRVLAFSTLTQIIEIHRSDVIPLLCKSKAVALLFTDFEEHGNPTDYGTRASHMSFAESLIVEYQKIPNHSLVPDLYFDSLFYSPDSVSPAKDIIKALQTSDFVPIFIRFAHSCFIARLSDPCRNALVLVRQVLQSCDVSTGCSIIEKVNLRQLYEISLDRNGSLSTFLACDILSCFMLYCGWGTVSKPQLRQDLFSDKKLRSIGAHIQDYLFHPIRMNENQHLVAAASLRVLRAALVFRKGMEVFADCLPAISSVCSACNSSTSDEQLPSLELAARESFYGLEVYVFSIRSSSVDKNPKDMDKFALVRDVSNRLVGLVPISHAACSVFTKGNLGHCIGPRAAASHFLGSFYSVHSSSISAELIPSVLELATEAVSLLEKNGAAGNLFFDTVSFVHGTGRMLVKRSLPGPSTRKISMALLKATQNSHDDERRSRLETRVLANAASEWLVKVAGSGSSLETARQALNLLNRVSDPRVILELLFKCAVNPELMCFLNPKINIEMARRYVEKLKDRTLNTLISEKEESLENPGSTKEGFHNLLGILKNWLASKDTVTEGASISLTLVNANLIPASSVYSIIPFAPLGSFEDNNSLSELVRSCGTKTYKGSSRAFQGNGQTRISPFSSEKRPPLAERLISLAEQLAERGPFVDEGSYDIAVLKDCLASTVFNLICQRDAHVSLRLHLWRLCVQDCGGGTLFEHAMYFGDECVLVDDDDELIAELSSAIADGVLKSARCPTILQKIVLGRIETRLSSQVNLGVLRPILSLDDTAFKEVIGGLSGWQKSCHLGGVIQKLKDARNKK